MVTVNANKAEMWMGNKMLSDELNWKQRGQLGQSNGLHAQIRLNGT